MASKRARISSKFCSRRSRVSRRPDLAVSKYDFDNFDLREVKEKAKDDIKEKIEGRGIIC